MFFPGAEPRRVLADSRATGAILVPRSGPLRDAPLSLAVAFSVFQTLETPRNKASRGHSQLSFSICNNIAAYNPSKALFFEYLQEIIQQELTTTQNSSLKRYVPTVKKISGFTQKLRKTGSRVVVLQLCSPLQFGPLC